MSRPDTNITSRDVFPRHDDRAVIRAFLAGKSHTRHATPNATVAIVNGSLVFPSRAVIAWYDSAGSLCAKLASGGRERPASRLAINFIMDQMGGSGGSTRHVEREEGRDLILNVGFQQYFFDGALIGIDQPIVLVGPLGVLAYRAALGPHAAFQEY